MNKISTAKMKTNYKILWENWPMEKIINQDFLIKKASNTKIKLLCEKIEQLEKSIQIKDKIIEDLKNLKCLKKG